MENANVLVTINFSTKAPLTKSQYLFRCWVGSFVTLSHYPLLWRHNEPDCVSNHQPHDCLLNRLSGTDQRKHQSSASLAFVRGIHRRPVNSPHKWPVTRKMFPFDDVIMRTNDVECHWCPHNWAESKTHHTNFCLESRITTENPRKY